MLDTQIWTVLFLLHYITFKMYILPHIQCAPYETVVDHILCDRTPQRSRKVNKLHFVLQVKIYAKVVF